MNKKLVIAITILILILVVIGINLVIKTNNLGIVSSGISQVDTWKVHTFFSATTTNATSTPLLIAGAKKITFFFSAQATSTNTSTFRVQISEILNDDTATAQFGGPVNNEFIDYNKLITNVTNTNSQQLTRVSQLTISSNGTSTVSMDLINDNFLRIRCGASALGDAFDPTSATSTCKAIVEY